MRSPQDLQRTVVGQVVALDVVPVAHDDGILARGAVRRAARFIVHVAGVDVVQPRELSDCPCARERLRRRGGDVAHLPVRVEGSEMQRHIRAEVLADPLALRAQLLIRVVLPRNEERRDLGPDLRLLDEVDQRIEHRLQAAAADLPVEVVGEALQVHVRRVHLRVELASRCLVDVPRRDGDRPYVLRAAGVGDVHRVLGEDHRVVVGERDRLAAELYRSRGDGVRARLVLQAVHLLRLRDIPVLAELAGKVAAGGAERQDAGARVEVIERLLLHRVDAEPGRAPVRREHHLGVFHLAHEAEASLALVQLAVAGTEIALDATVRQRVPPAALHGRASLNFATR